MPPSDVPWIAQSRTRVWLSCAVACLIAVAAFGLIVTQDRSPLDSFDHLGMRAERWAHGHATVMTVLHAIEIAFATIGMTIWTTLIAVVLLARRRWRAAAFVVVVMVSTSLLTTGVKLMLGRSRPQWQDTVDTLTSKSFPSGHASSSAALAGVIILLVWGMVRGGALRTTLTCLAILMWVVVCLDRVFLGRHFPTDVLAGSFLGVAVVLIAMVVFDPLSHRRPSATDAEEAAESIVAPHADKTA